MGEQCFFWFEWIYNLPVHSRAKSKYFIFLKIINIDKSRCHISSNPDTAENILPG